MRLSKKLIITFIFCAFIAGFGNYYIYKYSEKFPSEVNKKQIENTNSYTTEDYYNLSGDQLKELQSLYYGNNIKDKCEIVSNIILDKYNESDIDSLNILSILYEESYDFENSLKYKYRMLPLVEKSQLPVIYDNMADMYLINDLDKSIELLEKAVKIDSSNSNLKNKLEFFKSLESDFNNENKNKYYKKIVNKTNINILDSVNKYIKEKL